MIDFKGGSGYTETGKLGRNKEMQQMVLLKKKWKLSERQLYYFAYSVLFVVIALIVFSWYFLKGKFLVWTVDGFAQHYKALVYYSEYMRDIIKNLLLQHELIIPHWDFSIGEGSDILQTLHYYVIGDPFLVCSILIPARFMYLYYTAAVLLRIYLSGIAFSALCFQLGNRSRYAVMAGSMAYIFCYWSIFQGSRHPYFLNPMLYLPLLLLGVEKMIKRKKPYLFILTVAVSALSNIYFFYVLVCITILYVLIRSILLYYKDMKSAFFLIIRIGAASVLGLMLAAVIFLPMCYAFFTDARSAVGQPLHLFYPFSYYLTLPAAFLSTDVSYELCMGFAAPVLPAIFLMFYKRKKFTLMKIFFTVCVVITIFPFCGQILNGFSYMSNRWCFAFALVVSYILTATWPFLMRMNAKEASRLTLCTIVYFLICLLSEYSRTEQAFSAIILCMIMLFILNPAFEGNFLHDKRKQRLVLLTVLVSVALNSFWKNAVSEGDDAQGMDRYIAQTLISNETALVAAAAEADGINGFYRYSGRDLTANANMIAGISSTQYYWTISNPYIAEYRRELNLIENTVHRYVGYDDRAALNALASVLYYAVPSGDPAPAPYGFSPVENEAGWAPYRLYQNDYALPFSYTYDNYILADTCEALSAADKQNCMLQSVVLFEEAKYSAVGQPVLNSDSLPYTITCNSNEVTQQGNTFVVTSENSSVTIAFEGLPDSETYLEITGLDFQGASGYDLYFGDEKFDPSGLYDRDHWYILSKSARELIKKERWFWSEPTFIDLMFTSSDMVSKALRYYTKDHSYYADRHDFIVNLGYSEDVLSSVTITFPERGIYSFDSIRIVGCSMSDYPEQIAKLKEDTLQNVVFGTDTVIGEISLDRPRLLCFSIPYSKGWRAYVDGKEEKLYQANVMHMALDLDAGAHKIELRYETPMLKEGIYLSLCGAVLFVLLIIIDVRRTKKGK